MRILMLFFALASLVFAQTKPVVIKAARMFDGVSDRIVTPGLIVVLGEKIRGVGATAEIPPGAEIIDLGDATILPGFMDAHTHLTLPYDLDYRQQQMDALTKTVAEQALDSSVNARVTLMAGFTTVRDVGSVDFLDIGLRNAIASGKVPGPRMLVAINAIGATGGHCDGAAGFKYGLFGHETGVAEGVANGPDQMRLAVRFNIKYGADVIKTCATGGVLSLTDDVDTPQLTQAELDALVDEAHALRRKTAAHAHGASGAKRAIRAGIDSIEHGSFLDDEALDMMKTRGTYYVPTMMAAQGLREILEKGYLPPQVAAKARAAMASLDSVVAKAVSRQIKIALGTDAGVYPHGRNPEEFAQMVRVGMKPLDALKAGTSVDAQLLGLFDKTGSLEQGKWADIVAVPGNPVDDIHATEKVLFVMKQGTIFKNSKPHA
jgi:imidazolonepropionase-like amidohydrolase